MLCEIFAMVFPCAAVATHVTPLKLFSITFVAFPCIKASNKHDCDSDSAECSGVRRKHLHLP